MTARTTLSELIDVLRGMTDAGTADWTLGTATYWDGDQMQRVLDRYRLEVYREPLQMVAKYIGGGSVEYYEHYSHYKYFEATSGGTAVFVVEDAVGTDQGTANWSADYLNGKITFTSDTAGTTFYLTGRSYDINNAAADIWRHKGNHLGATITDFSTDNMSVRKSQIVKHCYDMADHYARLGGIAQTTTLYRSDIDSEALK